VNVDPDPSRVARQVDHEVRMLFVDAHEVAEDLLHPGPDLLVTAPLHLRLELHRPASPPRRREPTGSSSWPNNERTRLAPPPWDFPDQPIGRQPPSGLTG